MTRSRTSALQSIQSLLDEGGVAWLVVPRNIPTTGKMGARKRIQNFVVLDLPSVLENDKLEIHQLSADSRIIDKTTEFEASL